MDTNIGANGCDTQLENISNGGFDKTSGKELDSQLSDQHLLKYEKEYIPGRGFRRYNDALENLIPVRRKRKENGTMPVDSAGLFSFVSMSWISKFMYKGYSKGLKIEELPTVSPFDSSNYNAGRLEHLWKEELSRMGPENASFSKVARRFCSTRVYVTSLIQIGNIAFGILSNTLLMRKLLENLQSGSGSFEEGVKWALLLIASESTRGLLLGWSTALNFRTALRLRSACLTLVYKNIIRNDNFATNDIGEIINIFSNDAQTIFDAIVLRSYIVEAPIATVYGIFYILWLFGPMALLGIIAFFLFFGIQYLISRLIGYLQTKATRISDARVRLMNEVLDCMKFIKMYSWENRFSEKLQDIRKTELRVLRKTYYWQSLNASLIPAVPIISAIITFLAHASTGQNLTPAQVFPYSSFLDSRLRLALVLFRPAMDHIVLAGISFSRIERLLLLGNGKRISISKPILMSQAVTISHGTFAYNNPSDDEKGGYQTNEEIRNDASPTSEENSEQENLNKPTENTKRVDILLDVSFVAEKGKLVGICGQVGSGKTSLLLAALGQLRVSQGQVARDGSCAYVSQQAWITNATLRDNILFGEKFHPDRYQRAIHACNLIQDIETMPGGDLTEIGERGVNLSGGQRQRVALARALYADRDIYFLDDPLSAVDSRVGAHIFHNLILGALKRKTVLFVTHQIQYLNRCDDIYMLRNGRIIEHGTHDELMKLGNEYTSIIVATSVDNEPEDTAFADREISTLAKPVDDISLREETGSRDAVVRTTHLSPKKLEKPDTSADTLLTVAENVQQGTIKPTTYYSYIVAAGGYCVSFIVILVFSVAVTSTVFSSWWLALWIDAGGGNTTIVENNETIISDNIHDNPDYSYYQTIYAASVGIIILTSAACSFVYTEATIRASKKIHDKLFDKIISSPVRFFDTTPIGRIQHLFSKDIAEVDNKLPTTIWDILRILLRMFLILIVICSVFPWFAIPVILIAALYHFVRKIFGVSIRDLKRMENQSRAPVISFVTATVQGLSTIHAFGKENDFMKKFASLFDENSKHLFMFSVAARWLVMRIEALSVVILGITAFLVVAFQGQISPALAGLALSYAAQVSGVLPYSTSIISETEARFISVEKINHYTETLVSEGHTNRRIVKPPSNWPAVAVIKYTNMSMAYGEGGPLVLKNISFAVEAGEKIGIVGRTGSGKSSLAVALFRLVELAEGKIEIDGVDISEISLSQLRTKLSIIPQDPVLFSGTIRSNLDPFEHYTDAEIWEALEKTELKCGIQLMNGRLNTSVGFGGDNLSVGERQLLCLARALLRNTKILVLDEATAAVDPETEIAVQKTIQRAFSQCTILTIAHRLQTVLSLDRILVMDDGIVLEFDTPSNLLADPNSEFSKMLAAAEKAESK